VKWSVSLANIEKYCKKMIIQEFRLQRCSPAFHQISRRSGSSLTLVPMWLATVSHKPGKHLQLNHVGCRSNAIYTCLVFKMEKIRVRYVLLLVRFSEPRGNLYPSNETTLYKTARSIFSFIVQNKVLSSFCMRESSMIYISRRKPYLRYTHDTVSAVNMNRQSHECAMNIHVHTPDETIMT
jgi:hypothetical protein